MNSMDAKTVSNTVGVSHNSFFADKEKTTSKHNPDKTSKPESDNPGFELWKQLDNLLS